MKDFQEYEYVECERIRASFSERIFEGISKAIHETVEEGMQERF